MQLRNQNSATLKPLFVRRGAGVRDSLVCITWKVKTILFELVQLVKTSPQKLLRGTRLNNFNKMLHPNETVIREELYVSVA